MKKIVFVFLFILFSFNCYAGPLEDCAEYAKVGVPSPGTELYCRKGFLVAYDSQHKTPLWVIEHLTKEKATTAKVARSSYTFTSDPDLSPEEQAHVSDYLNAGYDKGHMAPAADMEYDTKAMEQCFYLSNIVPQNSDMNEKIWRELEEQVRKKAIAKGELYIITGPVYAPEPVVTIGKNKVGVPAAIFEIVYDPKAKNTEAYLMPNKALDPATIPKYAVPVATVEKESGLKFNFKR